MVSLEGLVLSVIVTREPSLGPSPTPSLARRRRPEPARLPKMFAGQRKYHRAICLQCLKLRQTATGSSNLKLSAVSLEGFDSPKSWVSCLVRDSVTARQSTRHTTDPGSNPGFVSAAGRALLSLCRAAAYHCDGQLALSGQHCGNLSLNHSEDRTGPLPEPATFIGGKAVQA